jgi:hypothetical protein
MAVTAFPQSNPRLIPASERLHRAVVEQRLTHPNDPILNRHIANAVAKDTLRGWRLDKAHRTANIDAKLTTNADAFSNDWQPLPGPQRTDYKDAAQFCKAERDFLGGSQFRAKYGGGANAHGKCVSQNH